MKKIMPYLCAIIYALLLSLAAIAWMYGASIFMSPFATVDEYSYFIFLAVVSVASVVGIIMTAYANFRLYPTKLTVKIEAVIAAVLFIPSLWMWDMLLHNLWFA